LINTYIEKTIGQLTSIQRLFQNLDTNSNDCPPIDSLILLAHTSSDVIRNAASTTSSIQHFERNVANYKYLNKLSYNLEITEDCRLLAEAATEFYAKFKDSKNNDDLKAISISEVLAKLQTIAEAMKALPAPINDLDQMESQLTDEIGNMEEAIKRAVEQIEELQKKSRETSTGEKFLFF
jgi:prefoldin subunit 5